MDTVASPVESQDAAAPTVATFLSSLSKLQSVGNATDHTSINVFAMNGHLFVMGPGFYGVATIPTAVIGIGRFYVTEKPDLERFGGGSFVAKLSQNSLSLLLNGHWMIEICEFKSTQGSAIGIDGTFTGTWWVQASGANNFSSPVEHHD